MLTGKQVFLLRNALPVNGKLRMGHNINFYISPQTAIRNALGNLGLTGQYRTMIPDLIRWTAEAQNLIANNRQSLPMVTEEIIVYNNQIPLRKDFSKLENITINGVPVTYSNQSNSSPLVTMGSPTRTSGPHPLGISFQVTQYYITFDPFAEDGTVATLQYLCLPSDEDGFPMIIESSARAIGIYVGYMLCKRLRDNRSDGEYKSWLFAVRQARATINEMTQEQLENIGAAYIGYGEQRHFNYWYTY